MVLPSGPRNGGPRFVRTVLICSFVAVVFALLRVFFQPTDDIWLLTSATLSEEVMAASDAKPKPKKKLHPKQLTCHEVFKMKHKGKIEDPNEGRVYARQSKEKPHFWFSLHEEVFDPVRWPMMDTGNYYEHKLSEAIAAVFSSTPPNSKTFIDVGGNIGWFTLVAAANGADVVVFEPNHVNLLRLCQSICLNGWDDCDSIGPMPSETNKVNPRLTILPLGVSKEDGQAQFRVGAYNISARAYANPSGSNPGTGQIFRDTGVIDGRTQFDTHSTISLAKLDTLADEMGWYNSNIGALKVDVEGGENDVFRGAHRLLKSKRIENIFMEGNVKDKDEQDDFRKIVKLLRSSGYLLHKFGGFMGPVRTDIPANDANLTENLLFLCMGGDGRRRNQCNIWWKVDASQ